jgi:hypothetical protein
MYYYCSAARARHAKSANATTTAITAHGTALHHDEIAHIHRIVGMWSLGVCSIPSTIAQISFHSILDDGETLGQQYK